jgi:hypothetical protein
MTEKVRKGSSHAISGVGDGLGVRPLAAAAAGLGLGAEAVPEIIAVQAVSMPTTSTHTSRGM